MAINKTLLRTTTALALALSLSACSTFSNMLGLNDHKNQPTSLIAPLPSAPAPTQADLDAANAALQAQKAQQAIDLKTATDNAAKDARLRAEALARVHEHDATAQQVKDDIAYVNKVADGLAQGASTDDVTGDDLGNTVRQRFAALLATARTAQQTADQQTVLTTIENVAANPQTAIDQNKDPVGYAIQQAITKAVSQAVTATQTNDRIQAKQDQDKAVAAAVSSNDNTWYLIDGFGLAAIGLVGLWRRKVGNNKLAAEADKVTAANRATNAANAATAAETTRANAAEANATAAAAALAAAQQKQADLQAALDAHNNPAAFTHGVAQTAFTDAQLNIVDFLIQNIATMSKGEFRAAAVNQKREEGVDLFLAKTATRTDEVKAGRLTPEGVDLLDTTDIQSLELNIGTMAAAFGSSFDLEDRNSVDATFIKKIEDTIQALLNRGELAGPDGIKLSQVTFGNTVINKQAVPPRLRPQAPGAGAGPAPTA